MEPKTEDRGHGSISIRREVLEKGCTPTIVPGSITLQVHIKGIVRLYRDGKDWQGGTGPYKIGPETMGLARSLPTNAAARNRDVSASWIGFWYSSLEATGSVPSFVKRISTAAEDS